MCWSLRPTESKTAAGNTAWYLERESWRVSSVSVEPQQSAGVRAVPEIARPEDEVSLMFSGGIDSTTAALALGRRHRHVHLLTYNNGYTHQHMDRTKDRVAELRDKVGDRYSHTMLSTKELFDHFLVNKVAREYLEYKSGFIWCLGCKMAMHTRSILYNLEHGVRYMADGSSSSTGEMVEQSLVSLYGFRELYAQYGIQFTTPVYTIPREDEIRSLKREGFKMGFRVLDRFAGVQPTCKAGEIYYLSFLLFDQPPKHDEATVKRFLDTKGRAANSFIVKWCADRGIPSRLEAS
jgi:hypothetical protein